MYVLEFDMIVGFRKRVGCIIMIGYVVKLFWVGVRFVVVVNFNIFVWLVCYIGIFIRSNGIIVVVFGEVFVFRVIYGNYLFVYVVGEFYDIIIVIVCFFVVI